MLEETSTTLVEDLNNEVLQNLQQATRTSERSCQSVADRICSESLRICTESQRIQDSGDVRSWAFNLANHRVEQCIRYYKLSSERGRIELHSTLSAIIYRYISVPHAQTSYQARLSLIEDFLQNFYSEAINAFRRENQMETNYQPRTALELAEYMAFTERYGKRRIPLRRGRSQQLIILRAQTFSKQQPPETAVDIEQATEAANDNDQAWKNAPVQRLREEILLQSDIQPEDSLRERVVDELMVYLKEKKQEDCADYFSLRLMDLPASEIEELLGLTSRQRDYLQQRFKYHLLRFALTHHWELVHEWLGIELDKNLGLTPQQWDHLQEKMDQSQTKLLQLKQQGLSDTDISQALGLSLTQIRKHWSKLLEQAWELRNLSIG
ncbi:MAG: heterocyst differentiation protein HetZ [Cyanobacteria bacterium P01_D01_bin.56]